MSADSPDLPVQSSKVSSGAIARAGSSDFLARKTGILRGIARVPAFVLVGLIRVYQCTVSPALPIITMGRCGCRFSPTCSHYAAEAIRVHGAGLGLMLGALRLLKCTPLHPGGLDPVPPRFVPACRRSPLSSLTSQSRAH